MAQSAQGTAGSSSGTPIYMAPEVVAGKPADARSDLYSLGVVLFQLLTGDLTRPVTTDWQEGVGDPLLQADLQRCFAGDPRQRFVGAGELARRLRALPERRAQRAAEEAAQRERERAAQRRGMMRVGALAGTLVVVFATLAGWAWRQTRFARHESSGRLKEWQRAEMESTNRLMQWQRAEQGEVLAKERLAESEAISKFLVQVFQSPDPARDGRTITVAEALGAAAKKLENELANQPARKAQLQATLGVTYSALGLSREAVALQKKVRDYHLANSGLQHPVTLIVMADSSGWPTRKPKPYSTDPLPPSHDSCHLTRPTS